MSAGSFLLFPVYLLVVSKQPHATRLPPAETWVRFSCSISRLFVLSHNMSMINTTGKLASVWAFSITASSPCGFTGQWSLSSRPTPHHRLGPPSIPCCAESGTALPTRRRSTCYEMLRFLGPLSHRSPGALQMSKPDRTSSHHICSASTKRRWSRVIRTGASTPRSPASGCRKGSSFTLAGGS